MRLGLRSALAAMERVLRLVLPGCDPNTPNMVVDVLAGLVAKETYADAKAVFYEMAK